MECAHWDQSYGVDKIQFGAVSFLDEANDELSAALEDMIYSMQQNEESKFTVQDGLKLLRQSPSTESCWPQLADAPDDTVVTFNIHLHSVASHGKDIWKMTDRDRLETAQKHKDKGSDLFKAKHYRGASIRYSKAIKYLATLNPDSSSDAETPEEHKEILKLRALCLLNLAACQLQLGCHDHVVTNCDRVLHMEPTNVKGFYRRAKALLSMKDFEAARLDLRKAKELDPTNQAIVDLARALDNQERAHLTKYGNALKGMFR